MKKGKKDFRNKLFIKDLENISGIKAHTIRIWEQRYKIFEPHRTDTGIRYYDEDQLRLILNISILNNNGYKISKIAEMGLDVCMAIMNVLNDGLGNPKYAASPLLINMVTAGDLGVKSGRGFYDYSAGGKDLVVAPKFS